MKNSLISEKELKDLWEDPNLVILDVSPTSNIAMLTASHPELMIKDAFLVNIKEELSTANSPFPNTFPSKEVFDAFSKSIGLNDDSIVVVYDNLGIYSSPRVWWIMKTMGFQNVSVLNGGLSSWIEAKGETEHRTQRTRPGNGLFSGILNRDSIKYYDQVLSLIHI